MNESEELLLEIFTAAQGDWDTWLDTKSDDWFDKVEDYFKEKSEGNDAG